MKQFETEKEVVEFVLANMPFAVKPVSKNAKTKLVHTFTSRNAFEKSCKAFAQKLSKRLID